MVTVAIPTFNRLNLLKRAIKSVLQQNYQNLEIVISDNASTDGTQEYLNLINDSRVTIIFGEENLGMVTNWDRCLGGAHGDYFLLMSDDDALLDEESIQKLVSGFLEDTAENVGVVFSDVKIERVKENIMERTSSTKIGYGCEEIITDFFQNRISIFPCATLLRTKDIRDLGGYSSFGAKLAVDACVWISLAFKYGRVRRVDEALAVYRIHHSLSSSSIEVWSADFGILENIVRQYRETIPMREYKKIRKAMHAAWVRIPLGYVARKYRDDPEYGVLHIFKDIFLFRKRIFALTNIYFVFNRIFRY